MKKAYLLLSSIVFSCGVNTSLAQVNVSNPSITYPDLTSAFAAINVGTHTGDIIVDITASIVEPSGAMATLNPSGVFGSSYTSVTIQPTAANIVVEGDGTAVINLRGADNVIIDGDWLGGGGSQDLTIRNNSIGGGNAAIWLSSTAIGGNNGALANRIANCIFEGVDSDETSYGIISGGSGTLGTSPTAQNNNNRYINNIVRKCRIGIAAIGGTSADIGLQIDGNTVGSLAAGEGLGTRGISVVNVDGALITNNIVRGLSADVAQAVTGIDASQSIFNTTIAGNRVHDITNTDATGFGAVGIYVNSLIGGVSNISIYNNEIHSIASQGHPAAPFAEDNGNYGIAILQEDGYDLYHNTVYLSVPPVTGDGGAAALYLGAAVASPVNLVNNVLINNTTGGVNYSVFCGTASALGSSDVDYNLYYSTGDLGYLGAVTATFADWKTVSGEDKGSVVGLPVMLVVGDGVEPDITDANCWLINGRGLGMASFGLDIDGATRSNTPGFPNDMGAREFTPAAGTLPPVATADAAPSAGGLTTYSVGQRKVARIQWGLGGTVPTTVDVQYYSGIDPALAPLNYPYNNRIHSYYEINETGGTGYTYQVELYFTDAENRAIPDGSLNIVKDTTGAGDWGNKGGSVTSDADGKYVNFSSVLSADGLFTIGNVPLGLDLLTFTAKNNNNVNDLVWSTAAEKNMTNFDVERSANGVDFTAIGSVKCNNNPITNNYKFRDVVPQAGYNYYRLKMNEKDGKATYSNIVAVKNGAVTNVDITSVYPNPASSKISVALNSLVAGERGVQVTDITGKVILSQASSLQEGTNEVSFDVSNLPSGMYLIKASLSDGTVSIQKFVKQ